MGLGSCLLAERADTSFSVLWDLTRRASESCLASNIDDRQGSSWTTSITIACSAQSSGISSGRWRSRSHLRFRLRLSHTSGTAACRCRILQPRGDIAGGADVDPAPRRWCPRRFPSRVGVLSNAPDSCDSTCARPADAAPCASKQQGHGRRTLGHTVGRLGDAKVLLRAFPTALRADVTAGTHVMPPSDHPAAKRREQVLVQGEAVEIPYRIYNPEPPADAVHGMNDRQKLIVGCIYSRHHDGHVRERHCAHIVDSTEPWVIPFVVQLLGEYVVEICALILDRLAARSSFSSPSYQEFARANSEFIARTEQRAVSYWSCYYRDRYARREYPAIVALNRLREDGAP
jgi:hypothetical protein